MVTTSGQCVLEAKDASIARKTELSNRHVRAIREAQERLREVGQTDDADRLGLLRDGFDSPELRVVVFGEFSRGKSSLINALLGRIVLQAKLVPTTGHVTRIVWGSRDEVRVCFRDGRIEVYGLDRLDSFSTLDFDRRAREDVERIEVAVACSILRNGLVLVDTPGVGDSEAQTRRAHAAIASADIVLLVLNATQLLTENEQGLAIDWLRGRLGKPVIPVLNWMNIVEERDQAELRKRIDHWSRVHLNGELGRPWFEVNALGALRHVLGKGPAPTDHYRALRSALGGLTGDLRCELQVRSRRNQLRADVTEARRANLEVLKRIRTDAGRVEKERREDRHNLQLLLKRFDVDTKVKGEALVSYAANALNSQLHVLIHQSFPGESKQRLEEKANQWYQGRLFAAIGLIEKRAKDHLLELTSDGLQRPEPMTVKERLILQSRVKVGELKAIEASDGLVAGSAVAGGVLGQVLIPIPLVGFLVGVFAGGWLASKLGQKEADYVAAYSEKAQEAWRQAASEVVMATLEQFQARAEMLKAQITQRLEQIDSAVGSRAMADEVRLRQAAEAALERCETELRREP